MDTEQSRRLVFGKSQKLSDEKVHATGPSCSPLVLETTRTTRPRGPAPPLCPVSALGPSLSERLPAPPSPSPPVSARPLLGALCRGMFQHTLTLERIGAMKRTPQEASGLKATCAFCKVKQRRLVSRGRRLGNVTGGLSIGRTGFSVSRCKQFLAQEIAPLAVGVSGVEVPFSQCLRRFPAARSCHR